MSDGNINPGKNNFWNDALKMVRLLALYFALFYGLQFIISWFAPHFEEYTRYYVVAAYGVAGLLVFFLLPKEHRKMVPEGKWDRKKSLAVLLSFLGILFLAFGLSVLLNRFISLIPWDKILKSEQMYSSSGYFSMPVYISVIGYGILAPFAEEVAFRGILFHYMNKWMPPLLAVLFSATAFAIYHGNIMQGLYAFLMGFVMGVLVCETGCLSTSILFHMTANIVVTLYVSFPKFYNFLISPMGLVLEILMTVLGIAILLFVNILTKGSSATQEESKAENLQKNGNERENKNSSGQDDRNNSKNNKEQGK